MNFVKEILIPGAACFANGCAVSTLAGDCPECGEPMRPVLELWVFRCQCGGWTFVNAAVVSKKQDDSHINAVECDKCEAKTGWFSPP